MPPKRVKSNEVSAEVASTASTKKSRSKRVVASEPDVATPKKSVKERSESVKGAKVSIDPFRPNPDESYYILRSYFESSPNSLVKHQIDSYDEFITHDLGEIVRQFNPVVRLVENTKNNISTNVKDIKRYKNELQFGKVYLVPPYHQHSDGGHTVVFPNTAREKNLTYQTTVMVDVNYKVYGIKKDGSSELLVNTDVPKVTIGKIPVMLRSTVCKLRGLPHEAVVATGEDPNDPGGYFIINGNEKVVMSRERKNMNHIYFYDNRNKSSTPFICTCEIKSLKEGRYEAANDIKIKMDSKERIFVAVNPGFNKKDIPLFVLFRALGFMADKEIVDLIVYGSLKGNETVYSATDISMIELLKASMNYIETGTAALTGSAVSGRTEIRSQEDALLYIADKIIQVNITDHLRTVEEKIRYTVNVLETNLFSHIGINMKKKALFLGHMVRKLLLGKMNIVSSDDRDSLVNKRIDTPGVLMSYFFKYHFKMVLEALKTEIDKEFKTKPEITDFVSIVKRMKSSVIDNQFKTAFSTGNWATNRNALENKQGSSQAMQRKNYMDSLSILRRVVTPTASGSAQTNKVEIRRLHPTHFGMLDCVESPDGSAIGLVKNMALTCNISIKTLTLGIRDSLNIHASKFDIVDVSMLSPAQISAYVKIFVDGDWYACTSRPNELCEQLRAERRVGKLNPMISIVRDFSLNEIRVYTDSGRCLRPLYIVEQVTVNGKVRNQLKMTRELYNDTRKGLVTWEHLLYVHNVIEYVEVSETFHNGLIAMSVDDLMTADPELYHYTHCEIHPIAILGAISGCGPFADHNQGPRNLFNSAQSKQSMGQFALNAYNRTEAQAYTLYYPQLPLTRSFVSDIIKAEKYPSGQNIVVAVMCYTGYNQEDSIIFNKGFIDRGGFMATAYATYRNRATNDEKFTQPDPNVTAAYKRNSNYEKLQADGFCKLNTKVYHNDVIIGKVIKIDRVNKDRNIDYKDVSTTLKDQSAYIDRIIVDTDHEGYQFCKVRVRKELPPNIGDKFCSRHGQKGTIGHIYNQEDMPFTESGIIPDIIVSPHAFPSRMTIGQPIEGVVSKVCAVKGTVVDATPFNGTSVETFMNELEELGYERHGNEVLYNGFTGEQIEVAIFICPVHYQRLKHIVDNKIHSRDNTGPIQMLTKQPAEGRARDGGHRLGEMERDAMLGHGVMKFLKERYHECSDAHSMWICNKCGLPAIVNEQLNKYQCRMCVSPELRRIEVPFATKLMGQEVATMNIVMKTFTD